jgi:hypothetical protein
MWPRMPPSRSCAGWPSTASPTPSGSASARWRTPRPPTAGPRPSASTTAPRWNSSCAAHRQARQGRLQAGQGAAQGTQRGRGTPAAPTRPGGGDLRAAGAPRPLRQLDPGPGPAATAGQGMGRGRGALGADLDAGPPGAPRDPAPELSRPPTTPMPASTPPNSPRNAPGAPPPSERRDLIDALGPAPRWITGAALAARLDEIERDWTAADPSGAGRCHPARARRGPGRRPPSASTSSTPSGTISGPPALRKDAEKALAAGDLDQRRVRPGTAPGQAERRRRRANGRCRGRRSGERPLQKTPRPGAAQAPSPAGAARRTRRHFADGQLKQAEPLYQSIRSTLEHAKAAGLPAAERADAEAHLKRIEPQLRELQRWRRWGADTRRQAFARRSSAWPRTPSTPSNRSPTT